MLRSALLNVMIAAARKAARSLTRDFREVEHLQVSLKGPGNFVSAADHRAEKILREELAKARPGYGFLGEEGGRHEGTDKTHTWIVDPLDGTTNFLHGIPQFCVSIGLERQGTLIAGVIYNPIADELFTGERGKGAFLNDQRLRSPPAGIYPRRCLLADSHTAAAATSRCSATNSRRLRTRWPGFAGSARRRSTLPGSRPAASMPIGNETLAMGYRGGPLTGT